MVAAAVVEKRHFSVYCRGWTGPAVAMLLCRDRISPLFQKISLLLFETDIPVLFSRFFYLIPSLSALENVMFPAEVSGDGRAKEKAEAFLETVGLSHRKNNFPAQLSGGEQQRVAICRALVNEPQILFADEPTGNLDAENSDIIIQLLLEIHGTRKTTLIMAHDTVMLLQSRLTESFTFLMGVCEIRSKRNYEAPLSLS